MKKRYNKIAVALYLIICLTGCSFLFDDPPDDGNQRVLVFQDLLKQGWKIEVVNGKVVLVKQTEDGLLIQDVFGVMEEKDSLW